MPRGISYQSISDAVRDGRITPAQGARLLELVHEMRDAWKRRALSAMLVAAYALFALGFGLWFVGVL